jgi:SAM-dependent methyltransferase
MQINQEARIMKNKPLWITGSILLVVGVVISSATVFVFEDLQLFFPQEIVLHDFPSQGLILDIGGGGEGIIGQLKGDHVVAVDLSKTELENAPPGNLKIVMDARRLDFLDNSFNIVTSFCTLMYISRQEDQKQVFSEALRVLKPGGRFFIWDFAVPVKHKEGKTTAVFPVSVSFRKETVRTAYGVQWPAEAHDLAYYARLATVAGFEVNDRKQNGMVVYLELVRPFPESESDAQAPHSAGQDHHEHHEEVAMEIMPEHQVMLEKLGGHGPILDIGGGGEGVIGRLHEDRVVAIDLSKPELECAPGSPVKAVMNALDMPVVGGSVANVTSFYSLMYFNPGDLDRLFDEVHRVLAENGKFFIWDVNLQPCPDDKSIVAYPLSISLPEETIRTGYGARCPDIERDISTYKALAEQHGFRVLKENNDGIGFFLELSSS